VKFNFVHSDFFWGRDIWYHACSCTSLMELQK